MPGLYIITGGFNLSLGTIQGTGVTLYFTKGGGYGFGNVAFGNSSSAYMNAPTDASAGGIPAISLYTDPNWTGSGSVSLQGCNWIGDGIFYSPAATISLQYSNLYGNNYFGIDTYFFYEYQSFAAVAPNYATLPGGNPFHIAATLVQ